MPADPVYPQGLLVTVILITGKVFLYSKNRIAIKLFVEIIKNLIKLQLFKFILVGLFCACIEFLTFNFLISFFKLEYLIANAISIVIAVSLNYVLSRAFVFGNSKYSKKVEFLSFVLFSILALALNQCILWFFFQIVKLDIRVCKVLAIGIVAFFNYVTKKYIVFKA